MAQANICSSARLARLLGAAALVCVFAGAGAPLPALAQVELAAPNVPNDAQMLLEADTLVYDNDANTVTAVGGVQIDYGGNKLVAQRVAYDRNTGRLVASGNVEVVDSTGTKIFSQEVDVTDDFANGFANALRVETVDKTYFAAESAERKDGFLTTFNNGVYTACAPCEEKPDKAPIWRVKAQKIIWNGQAKTVRFERSRFEMFGFPIAYLPAFEVADPTVKRKTGFLIPGAAYKSELGFGLVVPFYVALSPTYDLTLTGTGYTKQGFLGQAEWRQRFNNGQYNLKAAGIYQADPEAFDEGGVNRGTDIDPNRFRGMIASKGDFQINPRWSFGWDVLVQTDKNFSYTYSIDGYQDYINRSEVYLTGLNDRNYFDLRAMHFQIQEDAEDTSASARNDKQPWVLPTLDYAYTPDEPIAGGELNIDVNVRSLYRSDLDSTPAIPVVRGPEGSSSRLTAEAEWKRSIVTDTGFVFTPLLAFRGDTIYSDISNASVMAVNGMAGALNGAVYSHDGATYGGVVSDVRSAYNRFMATAGLELRWPVLFSSVSASHVLEPMAQLFASPDEPYTSGLGVPNEDAQSFVFDAASLFERDRFSGYDRVEGGTRANVGLRYSGAYSSGWSTNAIFGQSYHLAGQNSFAAPDLVNAGAYSGLETETSDYVALAGFSSPSGFSMSASGRFDEQTMEVRRAELKAGATIGPVSLNGRYAFIQAQPLYGFANDRREVSTGVSARINELWRVFGSATYDFESEVLVSDSIGFAYDDECFSYILTVGETRDRVTEEVSRTIGFNISFRTLGDFGSDSGSFSTR